MDESGRRLSAREPDIGNLMDRFRSLWKVQRYVDQNAYSSKLSGPTVQSWPSNFAWNARKSGSTDSEFRESRHLCLITRAVHFQLGGLRSNRNLNNLTHKVFYRHVRRFSKSITVLLQ